MVSCCCKARRKNSISYSFMSILTTYIRDSRLLKAGIYVLAICVIALLLSWTPQVRATVRALGFVPQVLPNIPVKPAEWFTQAPSRSEITYPLRDGRSGTADLYVPAGDGKHSAVMFFLGVNPAGRNDERVVNLANAIARTGIVVMIPWSDQMMQMRVADQEVDDLVRGFEYMLGLEMVDGSRAGMAGFCVGASLMMVAAQDERIRDDVNVVNSFGGYYDAKDLMASVVAERRFYGGESRAWEPDVLSIRVVRTHLMESVEDERERAEIIQLIEDGASPVGELSEQALVVYELLNAPDIETAHLLIERLPQKSLDTLIRISPSTNIGDLRARVLAMHDREDKLVPSEESLRLVDALQSRGDIHYTEFSFFDHLNPTRPVGRLEFVREGAKLFAHMYRIMRELS